MELAASVSPAVSYQLNWIPSCPILPSPYSPAGRRGALLPWLAVSPGESLLFSDSKHAILVRMCNRHDRRLRSRCVSSWLFVPPLLRSFVPSMTKACSSSAQPLGRCTHRTATNTVLRRYDHHPLFATTTTRATNFACSLRCRNYFHGCIHRTCLRPFNARAAPSRNRETRRFQLRHPAISNSSLLRSRVNGHCSNPSDD